MKCFTLLHLIACVLVLMYLVFAVLEARPRIEARARAYVEQKMLMEARR